MGCFSSRVRAPTETEEPLRPADEEALRALRAASPALKSKWKGGDPSKWIGVTSGDGRVRELNLQYCSLKELPAELGQLTGLTTLTGVPSNPSCRELGIVDMVGVMDIF